MSNEACPVCRGSGSEPDGCGCQCVTEVERAVCAYLGCVNCNCAGCGGSCDYCGGTGKKKDWQPGGPYPQDYVPDEEKD
ncbi:hypothetical protein K2P47_03605 [Patescibacteria group bacterium]|nr:hypothetical protein [Patescibacteria group bacterium]